MTDKEKLEGMLPYSGDRFEDIVEQFLRLHISDFSPSRLRHLLKVLEIFLDTKINCYELALSNSYEKACYIKSYLEGGMWKNEELAKANVGSQITNAESIIDYCYIATGRRSENGT